MQLKQAKLQRKLSMDLRKEKNDNAGQTHLIIFPSIEFEPDIFAV